MRFTVLPSLIASLFLLSPTFSEAQTAKKCTLADNYCVPFIGCVAERDLVIAGRSYGRKSGIVVGVRNDKVVCKGTWRRTVFGGKVKFACEDGLKGRVRYNVLDKPTGTVSGHGRNNDGSTSRFWSGTKIFDFLSTDKNVAAGFAKCGEVLLRQIS